MLLNTSLSPIVARVSFFADAGTPVALPLNLPQTSGSAPLLASTLERTVAGSATLVIDTASAEPLSQIGWVQVLYWDPGRLRQLPVEHLQRIPRGIPTTGKRKREHFAVAV